MSRSKTKSKQPMPLAELVERYIANPPRGPMTRDSATKLRRVATDFSEWLGCESNTGHFTEEIVDRFLNWRGEGTSPGMKDWLRKTVTRLWKFAAVEIGCTPPPFRLQREVPNVDPIEKAKPPKRASRTDRQTTQSDTLAGLLGLSPVAIERLKTCVALFWQFAGELGFSAPQTTSRDTRLDRIEEALNELRGGNTSQADQPVEQPATEPADTSLEQPLQPSSPLADLLALYIDERGLRGSTKNILRSTLRSFERFLKRPALVSDIGEAAIKDFVSWRRQTSTPETCDRVRVTLTSWWRFAAELRLLEPPDSPKGFDQELAGCLSAIAARNAEAAKDEPALSLDAALELYVQEKLPFGAESTKRQLRINVKRLRTFLGRQTMVSDLTDEVVRQSMVRMHEKGLSPRTMNKFRDNVLAIWRFLNQRRIVATLPEVKPVNEPKRDPIAWSRDELAKLWQACEAQPGLIGDVPARLWWHTLHAVAWDTGERISALLGVPRIDVDVEREWIRVRAEHRKGKRSDMTSKLHPDTCKLLEALLAASSDPLVFPWPFDRTYLWTQYGQLLEEAGLPNDRQHKFHCLRKSAASYFDAAGGNAQQLLGHADARVTQKYLDPRIVRTTHASELLFRPGQSATESAS